MGRRFLAMSGIVLLAGAVLAAADFWEETEFTAWSDKDVEQMMNDSPWAKRLTVRFPRTPRESRGGRFGGFRPGTSTPQTRLVIQWQSAQPIRQAMVRGRIEQGGTVDPEAQVFLDQSAPGYVVVVTGLPGQFGRLTPEALMAEARLERKGKSPIVPAQAQPQRAERGVTIVYLFPKDDAIVLEDKEVEFITEVGDVTIKKKFTLEDMVFNDQLEL
ncbi:MAG TPA: hypothetical protein EYM63_00880 [Acidobacteria bacterium]|nr:hypothetical protein [Acidobacteriota bacterium]